MNKKNLKVIQRQKNLHVVKIKVVDAFLLQEKLLKPSACDFVLSSALIAIEEWGFFSMPLWPRTSVNPWTRDIHTCYWAFDSESLTTCFNDLGMLRTGIGPRSPTCELNAPKCRNICWASAGILSAVLLARRRQMTLARCHFAHRANLIANCRFDFGPTPVA